MVGGAQRESEIALERQIVQRARELGVYDRIRFLGQRSDVDRLLAAADVYSQPNRTPEGFGLAFVEACLARLPLVSTAMGGPLEIIDPSCGFLVTPDNAAELAGVLGKLIDDEPLRRRLGEGARTRIFALCDPDRQLNRLHELLVAAVGNADYSKERRPPGENTGIIGLKNWNNPPICGVCCTVPTNRPDRFCIANRATSSGY